MKLNLLEGFRGYMALWVVFYHASGFLPQLGTGNPVYRFLFDGILPVVGFIILSGFVTHILLDKKEDFKTYIYRRALRLFPIFLATFFVSLLMLDFAYSVLEQLPFDNKKIEMRKELIMMYYESNRFLNILSHLTLTHGLFPNNIFPFTYTIMGQSWSLTLEWQFYLFIPIVYKLLSKEERDKGWKINLILLISFLVMVFWSFGNMPQNSFLPFLVHYFLVGFFSYSFYKQYRDYGDKKLFYFLILVAIGYFFLYRVNVSIIILLFMMILYFQINQNRIINKIFGSKVPLFLGKISYSVYCTHMIVLYIIGGGINYLKISDLTHGKYLYIVLFLASSMIFTIILSHFTYKYIEEYFIKIGKNLNRSHNKSPSANV
ncbi:MAG: acyltransferase [Cruoricaptor ignavus]|nr:acyltransferase [Cruoricaptor ignavus]